MKLSAKAIAPFAVLAIAVAATAAMISARPATRPRRPAINAPLVQVIRAEPGPVQLRVLAQGTVEPRTESELVTEVSGRIVWVSPELASGGFFGEGDPLMRIDRRDYEVTLEGARATAARARSDLVHAEASLERQRSMRQTGASSRARLDDAVHAQASAQAGLRQAHVAVRRAELDLERSEIRAPFAGRVREKRVDVGQFVGRGVPVARIYSVDYAEVRLPISDADLAYLELPFGFRDGGRAPTAGAASEPRRIDSLPEFAERPGPAVVLSARYAGGRYTWSGRVVRTEGALDPRTRMLGVVVRIDDPYARGEDPSRPPLPIGLFVEASIEGRRVENVVELPRSALRRGDELLVVDDDDRLRVRRVEVLRSERDRSWIRAGLERGDRVVTTPLEVVTEGMKVRTTEATLQRDTLSGLFGPSTLAS